MATLAAPTEKLPAHQTKRYVVAALVILALCAVALEAAGRFGFVRVSRIQQRINRDYNAAIHLPATVNGHPTLLVVGNSLPLEGIDIPLLQSELDGQAAVRAFCVEQTTYNDWLFGLRRLFERGARPRTVLLSFSINHLVADAFRGEYFARFLMDSRDFPAVVRAGHLDPTTATTWLFANGSGWIGSKGEIRKWLLARTLPAMRDLVTALQPAGPAPPDPAGLELIAIPRLTALRELCSQFGARLVIAIPPTKDRRDPSAAAIDAGKKAGVPVLIPYLPGEMPDSDYADGYHLGPAGAKLFTTRLAAALAAQTTSP